MADLLGLPAMLFAPASAQPPADEQLVKIAQSTGTTEGICLCLTKSRDTSNDLQWLLELE